MLSGPVGVLEESACNRRWDSDSGIRVSCEPRHVAPSSDAGCTSGEGRAAATCGGRQVMERMPEGGPVAGC